MLRSPGRIAGAAAVLVAVSTSCSAGSVADRDGSRPAPTTTSSTTAVPTPTSAEPIPVGILFFPQIQQVTDDLVACSTAPGTPPCQTAARTGVPLVDDIRDHLADRPETAELTPVLEDLDGFATTIGLVAEGCDSTLPDHNGEYCAALATIAGLSILSFRSTLDDIE